MPPATLSSLATPLPIAQVKVHDRELVLVYLLRQGGSWPRGTRDVAGRLLWPLHRLTGATVYKKVTSRLGDTVGRVVLHNIQPGRLLGPTPYRQDLP